MTSKLPEVHKVNSRKTDRTVVYAGVGMLVLSLLSGCVKDAHPTNSPKQELPQPPVNLAPQTIDIYAGAPEDFNDNGYADTLQVNTYLFNYRYVLPIECEGSVDFYLRDSAGRNVAEWHIPSNHFKAARRKLPPGVGYVFRLTLLDFGSDENENELDTLTGVFIPDDGSPEVRKTVILAREG